MRGKVQTRSTDTLYSLGGLEATINLSSGRQLTRKYVPDMRGRIEHFQLVFDISPADPSGSISVKIDSGDWCFNVYDLFVTTQAININ